MAKHKDFSYCFGVYPTIELLTHKPKQIIKVFLHSKGATNSGVAKIKEFCRKNNIKTEIADGFLNKISGSENTYAAAQFQKYDSKLDLSKNHLVLVGPRDSGNLGTIIRTAIAFDIKDIAIIRPAVDIFDPKVVRASMGAVFQVNFQYFENFKQYQSISKHNLYPFMTNGEVNLVDIKFTKPFALIFGPESSGLDQTFTKIGTSVSISQSRGVDSLNLAAAVAIGLYKSYLI